MNHPIPKHLITKATVVQEIEGQPLEYTLTFTVFGEVLEVQNHFLEMPEAAKRLLFSNKVKEVEQLTIDYGNLFTYSIPFAGGGYLEAEKWDEVYEKIIALKTNDKTYAELNESVFIKNKWLISIYALEEQQPRYVSLLAKLFEENKQERIAALLEIGANLIMSIPEVCPILIARLQILKDKTEMNLTYKGLVNFQNKKTLYFLINRLEDETYEMYHESILYALSHDKSEIIKQTLLSYYKKHSAINEQALYFLTLGLSKYRTREVIAFMKLLLKETNSQSVGIQVIDYLKNYGIKSAKIAEILMGNFLDKSDVNKVRLAIRFFAKIEDPKYLPTGDQLIDCIIWGSSEDAILDVYYITRLFERKIKDVDFNRLESLLSAEDEELRDRVLTLIAYIGGNEQISVIVDQANFPERFGKREIIIGLCQILRRHYDPQVLPILIYYLEGASPYIQDLILGAFQLIQRKALPEAIIDPVILLIQSESQYIRRNALEILSHYRGKKIEKIIKACLNDTSKDIQKLAAKNLKLIEFEKSQPIGQSINPNIREGISLILQEIELEDEPNNGLSCFWLTLLLICIIWFLSIFFRN